jgi:hypothetical protein
MNDVLDFGGHFYPLLGSVFSKEGVFQQPRPVSSTMQVHVSEKLLTNLSVSGPRSEKGRQPI